MTGSSTFPQRGWTCIFENTHWLWIWHPTAPWELELGSWLGPVREMGAAFLMFNLNRFCHVIVICSIFCYWCWQPCLRTEFYLKTLVGAVACDTIIGLGRKSWSEQIRVKTQHGTIQLFTLDGICEIRLRKKLIKEKKRGTIYRNNLLQPKGKMHQM